MNRKKFVILLICVAAGVGILSALADRLPSLFPSILSFPREPAAEALKRLSEAGPVWRGAAAAAWIGLSAIPALAALHEPREKAAVPERAALWVLSAVLLAAIYGMVNPQAFCPRGPVDDAGYLRTIRGVFDITVWAAAALYVVLRLIRLFRAGEKEKLFGYMRVLLKALCVLFAAVAASKAVSGCLEAFRQETAPDTFIGVLRSVFAVIPNLLDIGVILHLLRLLDILGTDEQQGLAQAAEKLSGMCCLALGVAAAVPVLMNVMNVILMPWLSNVSVTADIPIVSLAFAAVILLVSRLLIENKRLREDNSLFI